MIETKPVLDLRPTQFALGMDQVAVKTAKLEKMAKSKLKAYLKARAVPVVIAPWKELYMRDHHHLAYSLWQMGISTVQITVVADLSTTGLTYKQFWEVMIRSNSARLYDQFGDGPRDPLYLPRDIRGLADDPYRSLAWAVRMAGGYRNSRRPFAEFEWADFFRKAGLLAESGRDGLGDAVKMGVKLATSGEARGLPGFRASRSK